MLPTPGLWVAGLSPVMVTEAIWLILLWWSWGGCHQANQLAGEVVSTAFSDKGYCFQGLWSSINYLARPHASRQRVSVWHPLAAGGVQLSRGPLGIGAGESCVARRNPSLPLDKSSPSLPGGRFPPQPKSINHVPCKCCTWGLS